MKPLKIALLHFEKRPGRVGWWAYDVPEFEVTKFSLPKYCKFDVSAIAEDFDILIQEDRKLVPEYFGSGILKIYQVRGGTDNYPSSYYDRHEKASKGFDAILVDALPLSDFEDIGVPVIRFNYCVNDLIFYNQHLERDIDISSHMIWRGGARKDLKQWLNDFCKIQGLECAIERKFPVEEYAKAFNRSKITINLAKKHDRNYRVFESLACGACLVTNDILSVSGEDRKAGEHYLVYRNYAELEEILKDLLETGYWRDISKAGHELVMNNHLWRHRASELYIKLLDTFPELGK